jgi:hypothetical protein
MASKFQIPIAFKSDPRGLQQAESAIGGFGKKLAGIGALVAGAFAVRAIFNFGKEAVLAAEQVSTANNTLIAVAKATGVFGKETDKVTKSLIDFAKAQERRIGVDENVVKNVQAQLLSFKQLSVSAGETGGVFERTTKAAFDMAVVLKKDAGSQAIALGKALEDPINGLTALRRGGTIFTEQQKDQIRVMQESGDLLGAQTLILEELESQYGGAAEASANWSDRLSLAVGNIKEAIGDSLTPAFERFAIFMVEQVIPPVQKFFEDDFPKLLEALGPIVDSATGFFEKIGEIIRTTFDIDEEDSILQHFVDMLAGLKDNPEFTAFIEKIVDLFDQMLPDLVELVIEFGKLAAALAPLVFDAVQKLLPVVKDLAAILDDIAFFINEILSNFNDWEVETPGIIDFLERILVPTTRLRDVMGQLKELIDKAREAWVKFRSLKLGGETFNGPGGGGGGGARAVGGPVSANRSYMVGERGPEMFTPGAGGFITPNNRLNGGGSTNITINVSAGMGVDGARLGQEIVSAIKKYERVSGPVFASA